jgi:predicted DCC family thiol-disulfide oxidoreductase YuxK
MKLRPNKARHELGAEDKAFLAQGPVYLFDGVCVLCSRAVHFSLKHQLPNEAPVRFVAIQSALGRRLAEAYGVDPDKPYTFLLFDKGEVYERTDAIMALASHQGGPARLAPLMHLCPRLVRNFFYDRIALNRYPLFGKMDYCIVPDAETRARFVLPE